MLVFPEIDKKQTKKKAHQVLSAYLRLRRIAGTKRVTIDRQTEEIEDRNSRKFLAIQEVSNIEIAVEQLESETAQLLKDKYMNAYYTTNIAIYMDLHMSESKFYRLLDHALICFAEVYEDGILLVER